MANLAKKSNGNLLKKANGNLVLWSAATYSYAFDSSVYWDGSDTVNIAVGDMTSQDIIDLIDSAISNYASGTSSGSGAEVGIYADYGGVGYTDGFAFAQGSIFEITADGGRTFGTPTGDLTITASGYTPPMHSPWDTTGCTYKVGTSNTKPSGDPRGWGGSIVTAGTSGQTIQDEALLQWVWICCLITPWSGQSTDLSTPRGMETTLAISDLKE